jgi:Ala-tRNA(Pro) deacylase
VHDEIGHALTYSLLGVSKPTSAAVAAPASTAEGERESSSTHDALVAKLKSAGIKFTLTTHAPVMTSIQAAEVRGVDLASGAKAMIVHDKGEYINFVVSASEQIDWKKTRKIASRKAKMASHEQVQSVTGCISGAVPPFGSLWGMRTIVDTSLEKQGTINFNAGLRTHSISMSFDDFMAVERAELCVFRKQ